MKKVLLGIAALLALLITVVVVRTFSHTRYAVETPEARPAALDEEGAVERLRQAIRIPTISHEDQSRMDRVAFQRFHEFLANSYPLVHDACSREVVAGMSLLYEWRGRDSAKEPVLLLAHQDVVPIGAPDAWEHPPFGGELSGGYIWGRGTLDDKGALIMIMEAMEALIAEGFQPERTIYVCLGHDEEVGGYEGAAAMAALLEQRGVRAACSVDEGLAVIEGLVPGMTKPVGLIGLTEKGYMTVRITAEGPGGHSSQPPAETSIGILARAITRLEENPMPAKLRGPFRDMFTELAPEMPPPMRAVFANLWLFRPLIEKQLLANRTTAAALRTTTALTMLEAGSKDNVLSTTAHAAANFRIMPWNTCEEVLNYVETVIGDPRVSVKALGHPEEAPPIAERDNEAYRAIELSIRQVFPGAAVAPSMMIAGSDSHHYQKVTGNLYHFNPYYMNGEYVELAHAPNERIAPERFIQGIQWFVQFMRNFCGPHPAAFPQQS